MGEAARPRAGGTLPCALSTRGSRAANPPRLAFFRRLGRAGVLDPVRGNGPGKFVQALRIGQFDAEKRLIGPEMRVTALDGSDECGLEKPQLGLAVDEDRQPQLWAEIGLRSQLDLDAWLKDAEPFPEVHPRLRDELERCGEAVWGDAALL